MAYVGNASGTQGVALAVKTPNYCAATWNRGRWVSITGPCFAMDALWNIVYVSQARYNHRFG
jgi:hypothetical protein